MKYTYEKEEFHVHFLTREILNAFPEWAIDEKRNKFQIYRENGKLVISLKDKLLTVSEDDLAQLQQIVDNHLRIVSKKAMTKEQRIQKLEAELEELKILLNQTRS